MRYILPMLALFVTLGLRAQIVLTYEDHCYSENENYWYQMVDYQEPGDKGENCIWNFSKLQQVDVIDGEINTEAYAIRTDVFPQSSLAITENGNTFIYTNRNHQIMQLGYVAKNSTSYVTYTKPFVKLKFPFTYHNAFGGEVELNYKSANYSKQGNYNVESDAFGLIILPNGKSYRNALRVHTTIDYQLADGAAQKQDIYRWYVKEERFPVMVLQDLQYIASTGKITHNYKAAYNKNSLKSASLDYESFFSVSPNPAVNHIDITFDLQDDGRIGIDLYNLEGKHLTNLYSGNGEKGAQYFTFQLNRSMISSGAYIVKVSTKNGVLTERLIVQE